MNEQQASDHVRGWVDALQWSKDPFSKAGR